MATDTEAVEVSRRGIRTRVAFGVAGLIAVCGAVLLPGIGNASSSSSGVTVSVGSTSVTVSTSSSSTSSTVATVGPTTSTAGNTPLTLTQDERLMGIQSMWNNGATGQGVDVAVIDSGVTPVQGLNGANKVINGPDISFDSQNPSTEYVDGYGHGTAMAGLIAGNDGTSGGFEGAAPGARIVNVKVGSASGAVDVSQIIAAIDWVVQNQQSNGLNIRVLNLSLGTDSLQPYQIDPLAHAAELAWRSGIVVVAAAGNQGTSATQLADPADDPYLLAVGAEDPQGDTTPSDGVVASFSSSGNGTRNPDLVAPGTYVASLNSPNSTLSQEYPAAVINGRYLRGSGTSQATALVSGGVADLLSEYPQLSPDQVKALLDATTTTIQTTSPRRVGNGLVNFANASGVAGWAINLLGSHALPGLAQTWPQSTGLGSLEAARGDDHISLGGVTLTGEQDIFGNPWTAASVQAEDNDDAWNNGTWNGATWSGATWSGNSWEGATWSGATWSGATWSGATWSGATWSGSSWYGDTWYGYGWA